MQTFFWKTRFCLSLMGWVLLTFSLAFAQEQGASPQHPIKVRQTEVIQQYQKNKKALNESLQKQLQALGDAPAKQQQRRDAIQKVKKEQAELKRIFQDEMRSLQIAERKEKDRLLPQQSQTQVYLDAMDEREDREELYNRFKRSEKQEAAADKSKRLPFQRKINPYPSNQAGEDDDVGDESDFLSEDDSESEDAAQAESDFLDDADEAEDVEDSDDSDDFEGFDDLGGLEDDAEDSSSSDAKNKPYGSEFKVAPIRNTPPLIKGSGY